MLSGGSLLDLPNRIEQPLPLAVEKSFDVVVAIAGESNHLDMVRRDGNAPLTSGGGPAEVIRDFDLADLEAGH
jgi:hypothetical protein